MAHDGEQPYKESALSLPKEYGDASLPKYPSLTYEAILETSQRDETHIDAPNLLDSEIDDENDGSRNHLTEKWTTHWNDQYDKVYYYNWSTRKTSWKSPWDDELEVAFECDGEALAVNDHVTRMTKHNDRQHCVEINNRATDDTNEIPNILNEKDNISPMAMASRRRIALLQKHRTRSKQPKGVVLVTTHTIIRTICTLCMMLLMSIVINGYSAYKQTPVKRKTLVKSLLIAYPSMIYCGPISPQ